MAHELILVRHGNTFAPGEKVVWCGARTDLPLVASGVQQAQILGKTLKNADVKPARILTGPLARTRQHADILVQSINTETTPDITDSLCEIDYGQWEALSTEEIASLGGGDELAAWDADACWPQSPGWSPEPSLIKQRVRDILDHVAQTTQKGPALIVTSNGILRFFAAVAKNPPPPEALKVRTGAYCVLSSIGSGWQIKAWNCTPDTPLAWT